MFGTPKIERRVLGDADIIDCSGKLTAASQGASRLENMLTDITTKFVNAHIVVNMAGVTEIDAVGIAALEKGRRNGGDVKLLNISKKLTVAQLTMLSTKFDTFTGEAQAVRSWSEASAALRQP